MKLRQQILLLVVSATSFSISAQTVSEGIIIYEQKINVHASLTGSQKAMKAFIPEFISSKIQLHFKDGLARLQEVKEEQKGGVQISTSASDLLMDVENMKNNSFTILGDEKFYTENGFNPKKEKIELLSETKEIAGYKCKSAKMKSENDEYYILWYCPDLPKYFSPMGLLALEGTILEIDGDKITYTFLQLEEIAVDEKLLTKPEGYTKVTEDQLSDLTEEFMEEMQGVVH